MDTSEHNHPQDMKGKIIDKYEIIDKLGHGAFSQIFNAKDIRKGEQVVIKTEPIDSEISLLKHEASMYIKMRNVNGMLLIKWYGVVDNIRCLVLPYAGVSLDKIKVTNPLVAINIFHQCIEALECIHRMSVIHRDIKPANILVDHEGTCRFVDFGLSSMFTGVYGGHIEKKTGQNLIGSPSYVSINVHEGCNPSRRDDLESLCYVYMYISNGRVPWAECSRNMICGMKKNIMGSDEGSLCASMWGYARRLAFEQEPEYSILLGILQDEIECTY